MLCNMDNVLEKPSDKHVSHVEPSQQRTLKKLLCNFQKALVSFLCKGIMLDSLHSGGRMAFCKLLLMRDVKDDVMLGAHCFSKRTVILSGQ